MKKLTVSFLMLLLTIPALAQEAGIEMADGLRASGKIYVVVICVLVVLFGLLTFLFALDRRLKKLEKNSSGKI
ncbi:CcmD family protein [Pedobacter sp. SYP-B3415]|uniref:CcmD family protein n=1 Tax=Pedobacter sp. SYP-B3415 TaxID=2496641 RepID=UPI00101C4E76|nr:CcmD family protein [Pedobacter sp. SYP-B3415]